MQATVGFAVGALLDAAIQGVEMYSGTRDEFSFNEVAISGVIGAGTALAGPAAGAAAKGALGLGAKVGKIGSKAEPAIATAITDTEAGATGFGFAEKAASKAKSAKEMADELATEIGHSRVTVRTPDKVIDFDLKGKAHHVKKPDKAFPTPHMKTRDLAKTPVGVKPMNKTTEYEAMTKQDVRTARGAARRGLGRAAKQENGKSSSPQNSAEPRE